MTRQQWRRGRGDGSIFWNETKGRWQALVDLGPGPDGRRRRKKLSGRTRAQVRDKLRQLQQDIARGASVGDDRTTLGEFLTDWMANVVPGLVESENTIDNYRWAVERHLVPALGHIRLRQLRAVDIDQMLRAKAASGMSRNSLMRFRSILGRALKHAERHDLVIRNVASLSTLPRAGKKELTALRLDQAKRLLEAARHDRLEAMWVTGLMLGLRPGELMGLLWDDVDLPHGVVHVRRSLKRERGGLRLGEPKTARSRRSLNLPKPVTDALTVHRERQVVERERAGDGWAELNLVFPTEIGSYTDPSNLRRAFDALTERAGIGHWSPNQLRHSAATLLCAAGVPIELVADLLGHDGTRMTALVYRHATAPSVNAAVAPMERMFGYPFGYPPPNSGPENTTAGSEDPA